MENTIDIRTLKQNLQSAKEERLKRVLQLGEFTYEKIRSQELQHNELEELAAHILNADKAIYTNAKTISNAQTKTDECPSCHNPLSTDAKFCGTCGQPNPNYKIHEQVEVSCNYCQEAISENAKYCPCCGTEQLGREHYDL